MTDSPAARNELRNHFMRLAQQARAEGVPPPTPIVVTIPEPDTP